MIRMVDRVLGQLSLADGLVWSDTTELDQIARVIDWVPIKALLGQRSGPGRGNISYPAEALLRCLLLGVWNNLSDPALEAQLRDRLSFRRFARLQPVGPHAGPFDIVALPRRADVRWAD